MSESVGGFMEGQEVWIEDGAGKMHPGIFVGETESASWLGGVPSAQILNAETRQTEVVSLARVTPRGGSEPT
jgi:hypothetical protein